MIQKFELEKELLEKVEEITDVSYSGDLEFDDVVGMIKDLIYEYHELQYKMKEQQEYCDEYHVHRKIDEYDEFGVSRSDF